MYNNYLNLNKLVESSTLVKKSPVRSVLSTSKLPTLKFRYLSIS